MHTVFAALTLLAAPPTTYIDGEVHAGIFAESGNEKFLRALGLLTRLGWRWDDIGTFLVSDFSTWRSPLVVEGEERMSALNLGVGLELLWLDGFVRSTGSVGASVLTRGAPDDEPGTTGFYLDIRPVAYRWQVSDRWHIAFAPVGGTFMVPVLSGIPLVELQFRTAISGEFSL